MTLNPIQQWLVLSFAWVGLYILGNTFIFGDPPPDRHQLLDIFLSGLVFGALFTLGWNWLRRRKLERTKEEKP